MREPIRFRRLDRVVILGHRVSVATTFGSRLLGLSLLRRERVGAGLLIPRCRSVHTLGMRFRLDLLFLDSAHRLVEIRRDVPPGRLIHCPAAAAVLEIPAPERRTG